MESDQRRLGLACVGRLLAEQRIGVGDLLVADLAVAAAGQEAVPGRRARRRSR